MSSFLIVYGTKEGQSQKIADFICAELIRYGNHVDTYDSRIIPQDIDPLSYDVIIIGASVHMGGFPRSLKSWVKSHAEILNRKPSAFFSVCLGILQKEESVQQEEKKVVESFFRQSNWHPKLWTIFAGALPYSKYNWFIKKMMKRIAKKAHGDTDVSRDYEYTDWEKVHQFTLDISKMVNSHFDPDSGKFKSNFNLEPELIAHSNEW